MNIIRLIFNNYLFLNYNLFMQILAIIALEQLDTNEYSFTYFGGAHY